MHRTTPLASAFVAYSGGGARALVDTINDETGMQEMKGSFMKSEARDKIESPQNYGFTSVVRPATKGKDGKIEQCAEAYINFMGGNRSFPVAGVMDDRRYRPWGLKPGENSQYDDIGQMTLMRRNGLFLLSLDSEDDSQQQQGQSGGSGGATPAALADTGSSGSGSQSKVVERMVSLRHVEKQKQPRPKGQQSSPASGSTGGSTGTGGATPTAQADTGSGSPSSSGQQSGKDFKHEGETVNTEVRCKKNKIEILDGTTVVATYDKQAKSWTFSNFKKLTLKADDEMNFTSKKVTIEATGDVLDLKGKPIKFNGGGPESPPFQVPG